MGIGRYPTNEKSIDLQIVVSDLGAYRYMLCHGCLQISNWYFGKLRDDGVNSGYLFCLLFPKIFCVMLSKRTKRKWCEVFSLC